MGGGIEKPTTAYTDAQIAKRDRQGVFDLYNHKVGQPVVYKPQKAVEDE